MSELKPFNKLVVIAPSNEADLNSGIDVDRYGDAAANIFFGYLERDKENSQIYIMGGQMGALATGAVWAEESTRRLSEYLEQAYRLPSVVMHDDNDRVDLESRFLKLRRRKQYKAVLGKRVAKERELGLIADDLQMELSRSALSQLGIQCASFTVNAPIFGSNEYLEDTVQEPVDLSAYITTSHPKQMTGDA